MDSIGSTEVLRIQTPAAKVKNYRWTRYDASIASAAVGALFFVVFGFFALVFYGLFDRNNTALNYTGVGSLTIAFAFMGIAAHFMDERDESNRQYNEFRIENLSND